MFDKILRQKLSFPGSESAQPTIFLNPDNTSGASSKRSRISAGSAMQIMVGIGNFPLGFKISREFSREENFQKRGNFPLENSQEIPWFGNFMGIFGKKTKKLKLN